MTNIDNPEAAQPDVGRARLMHPAVAVAELPEHITGNSAERPLAVTGTP